MSDLKLKFLEVYSVLKAELLHDPAFEHTDHSRQWVDQMLDYNVPRGKLIRGLFVIDSYLALREGKAPTDDEIFLACVLGWCIEWLQAFALIHDDIEDKSHTRRGQPCWFRLPKVEFQSSSGQLIDLISTLEGEKDLSKYTWPLYLRILKYKSAYYSFYLPAACALLMAGENLDEHIKDKDIFLEMGSFFQMQDDYLDCFGDPNVTGKIGTDIEDGKCSWLVVKALESADVEQKKVLSENYGKTDPGCVAKVKELYKFLGLQGMYAACESRSFEKLSTSVQTYPSPAVQALWPRCSKGRIRRVS